MGTVTLAEHAGNWWLVGGEEHVASLLYGDLDPNVTVVFTTCVTWDDLMAQWVPDAGGGSQPWVINPAIVARLKGQADPGSIIFGAWSAAMDDAAEEAIEAAAAWLAATPQGTLLLRQFRPATRVPGLDDLQRLRHQLVAAALERVGVAGDSIRADTAPAEDESAPNRLELVQQGLAAA